MIECEIFSNIIQVSQSEVKEELKLPEGSLVTADLLLFWLAPLGVRSAICRHQPPQRAVLSQVDCFVQCEVVGSHIALNSVQPRGTRTPWWSLPVLW